MRFNVLDNYSMEEIEEMLKNVIEVEEFDTDTQLFIEISDDFEGLNIEMSSPEEPTSTEDGTIFASQRK